MNDKWGREQEDAYFRRRKEIMEREGLTKAEAHEKAMKEIEGKAAKAKDAQKPTYNWGKAQEDTFFTLLVTARIRELESMIREYKSADPSVLARWREEKAGHERELARRAARAKDDQEPILCEKCGKREADGEAGGNYLCAPCAKKQGIKLRTSDRLAKDAVGMGYSDKTKCSLCNGVGERTSGNKCVACGGTGRVKAKDRALEPIPV